MPAIQLSSATSTMQICVALRSIFGLPATGSSGRFRENRWNTKAFRSMRMAIDKAGSASSRGGIGKLLSRRSSRMMTGNGSDPLVSRPRWAGDKSLKFADRFFCGDGLLSGESAARRKSRPVSRLICHVYKVATSARRLRSK